MKQLHAACVLVLGFGFGLSGCSDDDDGDDLGVSPVVRFSAASSSASEAAGTVNIVVEVSPPSSSEISVPFTLSGTATAGSDYTAPTSPLIIPANVASAIIAVPVTNDTADEPDETLIVTLGAPSGGGATRGSPSVRTLTVIDDDGAAGTPVVSFSSATGSALENAGAVNIIVNVTPPSSSQISVPFTLGGTATQNTDYSPPASPLVIPANATSGSIAVGVINDTNAEPDETVGVTLGTPIGGGATLGTPSLHTLTIDDDETGGIPQGRIFVITDEYRLLSFDAGSPGTTTGVNVTGITPLPDTSLPLALGIDFRPANGQLYLYVQDRKLYRLDPATGAATLVGSTPAAQPSDLLAMEFNPCSDVLRMISGAEDNLRINPNDASLVSVDTDLAYASGDASQGFTPDVSGLAYTACSTGNTTAYGIDTNADLLVRIGSEGGTPESPSTGQLRTIGSLGTAIGGAAQVPFDINTAEGAGYTTDTDNTTSIVFRVNLSTGTATNIGTIVDGTNAVRVVGLAVAP